VRHRILLVEDNKLFLEATKRLLEDKGYQVECATSGAEAIEQVQTKRLPISLVILDYKLSDKDGSETARAILKVNPELYIIVYSAEPSREALKSSFKSGAVDFVDKTVSHEELLNIVRSWCQKFEQTHLTVSLPNYLTEHSRTISMIGMVGRSESMATVVINTIRFRDKRQNVLILGESGVGKEHIAKALHPGSRHLFRAVNCASYNGDATLMESELFGAERGSYTGADSNRKGIFEDANGGTVFLDEIHTLSIKAQQKLLRVLQERSVRPVGSTREYPVNFRLVVAAKPDLEERIAAGTFLADLFYRLNYLRIEIAPLRERPEDIAPLVAYFCDVYVKREKEKKAFLARTVAYMERYAWPGNVRELENIVERLCAGTTHEKIVPEDLDVNFFQTTAPAVSVGSFPMKERIDQISRDMLLSVYKSSKSQREAARKLGMPLSTFNDQLKRYGLENIKKRPIGISAFTGTEEE
jgi:DNA-binding NtrC family response regulator